MFQPLVQLNSIDVKRVVVGDEEGVATRALIQCLRRAAAPLTQALSGSLSRDEHRLSQDLVKSIDKAERSLSKAWEQLHPGRKL